MDLKINHVWNLKTKMELKNVNAKGRTTSWIAELPNFEHVPHFIAELSANCSQTYILLPNQVVAMKYQIEFWI